MVRSVIVCRERNGWMKVWFIPGLESRNIARHEWKRNLPLPSPHPAASSTPIPLRCMVTLSEAHTSICFWLFIRVFRFFWLCTVVRLPEPAPRKPGSLLPYDPGQRMLARNLCEMTGAGFCVSLPPFAGLHVPSACYLMEALVAAANPKTRN